MIYATLHMNVTDNSKIAAYRKDAGSALAKHGGALVAASPEATVIEGKPAPNMVGILSFPDKKAALAWKNDPELQELHGLRQDSGESNIILVG